MDQKLKKLESKIKFICVSRGYEPPTKADFNAFANKFDIWGRQDYMSNSKK